MSSMESRFKLNFAPHIGLGSPEEGMFREHAGADPIDQIKFIADQGFRAIEDNFLKIRPISIQEKIGRELERQGMQMGCFVNNLILDQPTFVSNTEEARSVLRSQLYETIEVAKRVNGKWVTTLSGPFDPRLDRAYQTSNMIENLRWCAQLCESEGITLGIEPITGKWWPGTFLTNIPHGYLITKAVNSPACKLIFDVFQQQLEGGNIINNIDYAWDQICYFQIADAPRRTEPTTGELNYRSILQYIHAKGYTGIIEMEHSNSQPGRKGEQAVIDIYLELDQAIEGHIANE